MQCAQSVVLPLHIPFYLAMNKSTPNFLNLNYVVCCRPLYSANFHSFGNTANNKEYFSAHCNFFSQIDIFNGGVPPRPCKIIVVC